MTTGGTDGGARLRVLVLQAACVVGVVAVWQVVASAGWVSRQLLPGVPSVLAALGGLVVGGEFWLAVGDTLLGAVRGLVVAIAVAVPLGIVAGLVSPVERSARILVDFGRSFPAIALLPVFTLLYGHSTMTKSVVVFAACSFPLFVQALYGARSIEPSILEAARSFRIPFRLVFWRIAVPSAAPSVMTGFRLAATTAILVSVACEVVGGIQGLGRQMSLAQQDGSSATAYAYILAAGALGLLVTRSAEALEARFLRWRTSHV